MFESHTMNQRANYVLITELYQRSLITSNHSELVLERIFLLGALRGFKIPKGTFIHYMGGPKKVGQQASLGIVSRKSEK